MKQIDTEVSVKQKIQKADEQALKKYFREIGGFSVEKLDLDNKRRNPDFRISKSNFEAIIEIKSHFGNDLHQKITNRLAKSLDKLKHPYDYHITHKLGAMPSEDQVDQLMNSVEEKIKIMEESPESIEFPYPLWLGDEIKLRDFISEIEPHFLEQNSPKSEWYDLMVTHFFESSSTEKLLLTIWGNNRRDHLIFATAEVKVRPVDTFNYREWIEGSKGKFNGYPPNIPWGIIFVKHGRLDSLYGPAALPFGRYIPLDNFSWNRNQILYHLSPDDHGQGVLKKDSNTWLSFYGYFDISDEANPRLEIFRNSYTSCKLPSAEFAFPSCSVFSFCDIGNPSQLILVRNWPKK